MSTKEKEVDNRHFDKELDLSNAGRGVWLVKVPKYIASRWEKSAGNVEVGKLKISKAAGQKAQVALTLTNEVVSMDPTETIPRDHKLDVTVVTRQTLGVFSHSVRKHISVINQQNRNNVYLFAANNNNEVVPESEKIFMEGRIVQKLETRPLADSAYMKMKIERIKKTCEPVKKVKALDKVVTSYKPVSDHKHNVRRISTIW